MFGRVYLKRSHESSIKLASRIKNSSDADELWNKSLDNLHQYYHHFFCSKNETVSVYIVLPVSGAASSSHVYGNNFGKRQNQGVIFVYFLLDPENLKQNLDITVSSIAEQIYHKIPDFARFSSFNYLFNLGLELFSNFKRQATSSAIGSIMSRNGSHNIGSHVLSALSHKAGTMPDDRVLYQYIQQRMDYIATVTTEFPNWTGPTRFVSNLMKTFLSQRHLLEHISESEGLGAWHFRGRQISAEQKAKIKIHVRKVNWTGAHENIAEIEKDFILYSGQTVENQPNLSDDVSLAIPGGTVGQHAFYTILENIIRNAAKHGWSKRSNDSKETNLEIHIDFREKAESCEVEFTIWDNMSNVFDPVLNKTFPVVTALRSALVEVSEKIRQQLENVQTIWEKLAPSSTDLHEKINFTKLSDKIASCITNIFAGEATDLAKDLVESLKNCVTEFLDWKKLLFEIHIATQEEQNEQRKIQRCLVEAAEMLDILPNMAARCVYAQNPSETEKFKAELTELTPTEIEKLREHCFGEASMKDETKIEVAKLPLHWQLQLQLELPLISEQGQLRQENWGLAEMRISAGYLQRRDVGEIGGIAEDKKITDIITPVAVQEGPDETAKYHLGYRFTIPKPKKLLIVQPKKGWEDIPDQQKEELKKEGIYIKSIEEINGGDKNSDGDYELDYEYVVLPQSQLKYLKKWLPSGDTDGILDPAPDKKNPFENWLFPFRLLLADEPPGDGTGKKLDDGVINYEKLRTCIAGSDADKFNQIKKLVYEAWLAKVKRLKGIVNFNVQDTIYLQVQAGSGASGGGKGLMRDSDLYRIVFLECGHSVLLEATKEQQNKTAKILTTLLASMPLDQESFLPVEEGEESRVYIRKQLQHFCDRFKRELRLNSRSGANVNQDFVDSLRILYSGSDKKISADNLRPFERAFLRNLQLDLQGNSGLAKSRVKVLIKHLVETDQEKLNAALDVFCGKLEPSQVQSPDSNLSDIFDNVSDPSSMLKKNIELLFGPADSGTSAEFGKLVDKLNSAYQTSDIFLRKYEEDIPTLPEISWSKKGTEKKIDASTDGKVVSLDKVEMVKPKSPEDHTIRYVRHDNTSSSFYAEALSGSQSYLNALDQFELKNLDFTVRLVENALLRVLLVDERVCNFFATRPKELQACRKMRIFSGDVAMAEASQLARTDFVQLSKTGNVFGIKKGDFDILVIHQGIIDKWCSAHDKKTVDKLLKDLENVVPFVVVTTGRGRPDNIPDDARVLPFTTVESTIFRKYPEKLVLVNTVMNILPNGKGEGGKS